MIWCLASAWGLLVVGGAGPPPQRAITLLERTAWEIIRSPDGDFAFSMPARPVQEIRGDAGAREVLAYSCAVDGSEYRLQRIRSPQAVPPGRVIAEIGRQRRRYQKDDARLVRETPIVVDGVIGEDLTYTSPAPQGTGVVTARTRHFINGHFYYALTVTSPPGRPLPEDAARFLSSLTFEAVVKAHYARMRAEPDSPARPGAGSSASSRPRPGASRPPERPEPKARGPRTPVKLVDSTPEDALKMFVLAVAAQDEETLRAVALPDDDLARLLRRRPASPDALAQMKSRLDRMAMKRLKAGDTARLADGTSRSLQPDDVRGGRVVIWPIGATYATVLEDVGGHWKVQARPFIAARRAAESRGPQSRPPSPRSPSGPDR